jgi:hypothetical protein
MTATVEVATTDRPRPVFEYDRTKQLSGPEYVRAWECGRLLNVIAVAFSQAESCGRKAETATTEEDCRVLVEDALKCASTAEHYARMLLDTLRPADPWRDPAF